jgi:c(7)-type cytochrome triheme protein
MKNTLLALALLCAVGLCAAWAQPKQAPVRVSIESKKGIVLYYHFLHLRRAKDNCKFCHDSLFAMDAKAPLNYADHPAAESTRTSCGFCHRAGGSAFDTKGNCDRSCHANGTE